MTLNMPQLNITLPNVNATPINVTEGLVNLTNLTQTAQGVNDVYGGLLYAVMLMLVLFAIYARGSLTLALSVHVVVNLLLTTWGEAWFPRAFTLLSLMWNGVALGLWLVKVLWREVYT